ncbi:hypothetical protein [Swaminathania salitolerans]|uniref:Uncharacterized protein n=1 Tax=Swaminathania salitolerans TaxID=182838 RepID=A0A511BT03_9PROT|nr:hypothetical protein [Swaminathania salitolerans]GBQ09870.1 hypothetical protein AA21291_0220 [Swaminathania salitolerans LMG 21291]GEL01078.1 hypothetical protein SSA02_02410 [Swaminathania salitolerans]
MAWRAVLDWKLIFTREVAGGVVALLTTALLVVLGFGGMRISGIWSGL